MCGARPSHLSPGWEGPFLIPNSTLVYFLPKSYAYPQLIHIYEGLAVTHAATQTPDHSSDVSLSADRGYFAARVKQRLVIGAALTLLGLTCGWAYDGRRQTLSTVHSIDTRTTAEMNAIKTEQARLTAEQAANSREIFYAREDIRWLMRRQGVPAMTPDPTPPTTRPAR